MLAVEDAPLYFVPNNRLAHSAVVGRVRCAIFQQGDMDVIEYVEAYMEVLTALGDAENDLYSANFADYSGGGGTKVSAAII